MSIDELQISFGGSLKKFKRSNKDGEHALRCVWIREWI